MLDVELFGLNAGAHLLINAAFHAANAILLFLLLLRLTAAPWRSAIIAAIFAAHPLHVESVAWLAERKDVLSTLFYLLAIWFYTSYVRTGSRRAYLGVVAAFVLGLMSKGTLVTLPFLLLLLDYWPLERVQSLRDRVVEKLPLFAIAIAGSIVTMIAQRSVSAVVEARQIPFLIRLANAVTAYAVYVAKAFWPLNLIIPYEYPRSISSARSILAFLLIAAITAGVIAWRKRRYLFTGWFWFAGTLVPMIGLVQIGGQWMADRYMYFPSIGLSIAIVWSIAEIAASREAQRAATAVAGVVVLAFAAGAHAQASLWKTTRTLFTHTLRVDPSNVFAMRILGDAVYSEARFDQAVPLYQRAVDLRPSDENLRVRLGKALASAGRTDRAIEELKRASDANPRNAEALFELGRVQLASGRNPDAEAALARAAAIDAKPRTLGMLALARNDLQAARREFERAVKQEPDSSIAHNDLGAVLVRLDMNDAAVREYEAAIRTDPAAYDARMNLGALLSRMNRDADAAAQFQAAADLQPSSPEPLVFRAMLLANQRRFAEAAAAAERALRIDAVSANQMFTNAARIPFKPTNLQEFVNAVRSAR